MHSWFYFLQLVNGFSTQGLSRPQGLSTDTNFLTLLGTILNWFLGFVGAIAFLIFVWAGFMYITSNGKSEGVKKARTMMIYAIIGIVIILIAYAAITTLTNVLSPQSTMPTAVAVPASTVPVAIPVPATAVQTVNPDRLGMPHL